MVDELCKRFANLKYTQPQVLLHVVNRVHCHIGQVNLVQSGRTALNLIQAVHSVHYGVHYGAQCLTTKHRPLQIERFPDLMCHIIRLGK